ncbi:MAG: ATP-binding protein [Pseudomonadota bacterium]
MQQEHLNEAGELEQALATCGALFEVMTKSYQRLEHSFQQISSQTRSETTALEIERLSSIIQALPSGVVILDGRGIVAQCNPAAENLLGVPLYGQPWREIIARAFAPKSDDGHDISLADGRIVNISTNPLGRQPGQVILIHDVTNTRRLQDKLNHSRRLTALGEMTASMAHQIRTPLSAALLYCSQLNHAQLDEARRGKLTHKIIALVSELEHLVNDMLLFAKDGLSSTETFSLNDLVSELCGDYAPTLAGAIQLRKECEAAPIALCGNRQMLKSAVQNLVDNAMHALGAHGEITISVRRAAGNSVDVLVADNGPGIAAELKEKIFEPFFTTSASGTGLGLAVVRQIAQAHGGEVWVESQPGGGATFGVRLPMAAAHRSSAEHPAPLMKAAG